MLLDSEVVLWAIIFMGILLMFIAEAIITMKKHKSYFSGILLLLIYSVCGVLITSIFLNL